MNFVLLLSGKELADVVLVLSLCDTNVAVSGSQAMISNATIPSQAATPITNLAPWGPVTATFPGAQWVWIQNPVNGNR